MAKVFTKDQLPQFHSTRDTRDRLDLVTENVPVNAERLKADRIIYHPGDSAAKHYHIGAHHLFVMLEGEGKIGTPEGMHRSGRGWWPPSNRKRSIGLRTIAARTSSLSNSGPRRPWRRSGFSTTTYELGNRTAEYQPAGYQL